jgi:hypothetical protein
MSQADSAYTTSRSIFAAGQVLRRRQFVTGGAAILAGAITASRAERLPAPYVCSQRRMLPSGSCGMRRRAGGPSCRPDWLAFVTLKAHWVVPR